MDFTVDFYRDEVRCGFYIPTAVKQAWAANLVVLSEIDRICEKYGIRYFADWGSVLGAVRHGGYVPWDDDLDICMLRDDYTQFREVAPKELPERFEIQDYASKEDHWLMLSRVVSEHNISFDEEHLAKYHNFPYISVVDIFVQDYLYKDAEDERQRCNEVKEILAVADGIVEGRISSEAAQIKLAEYENRYGVKLPELKSYRKLDAPKLKSNGKPDCSEDARKLAIELYRLAEVQMSRVPAEEADMVGQIFPWILKGLPGKPKKYYEQSVRLPFENTTIPVPACYHEILSSKYGDYLVSKKVWSGHNYPYFEGQKKNLLSVADFELPEFRFAKNMLDEKELVPDEETFKGIASLYLDNLRTYTAQALIYFEHFDFDEVQAILPELQQMAVDLGNLTEKVKGELMPSSVNAVAVLQEYCDAVYGLFTDINGMLDENQIRENIRFEAAERLKAVLEKLEVSIEENLIKRRTVVFLTTGAKQWKGFAKAYQAERNREDTDVYVVALPVLFKDIYGRVIASEEEVREAAGKEDYPAELMLYPWEKLDVRLMRPDRIYIQDPYDGENPCLTVPSGFYASKLKNCTGELVYIPAFITGDFTEHDINDVYNMKHYVTAPGLIYADKVMLWSESMKNMYVDKLSAFAGEETRSVWEEKIAVEPEMFGDNSNDCLRAGDKKRLLYVIGLNELTEKKSIIIDKIKEKLMIFSEESDKIETVVAFFPTDEELWKAVDSELTSELDKMINKFVQDSNRSIIRCPGSKGFKEMADCCDAYYGSASPCVPLFVERKKPVMVADYGV